MSEATLEAFWERLLAASWTRLAERLQSDPVFSLVFDEGAEGNEDA